MTLAVIRQLDLVVLALALPVFVFGDLPLAGYATGAGAWLAQKALQTWLTRKAKSSDDPRTVVGLMAGSMIGRGWLCALSIFGVGLADNDSGLAAAVLVISLFTVYFTVNMITRPFDTPPPERTR